MRKMDAELLVERLPIHNDKHAKASYAIRTYLVDGKEKSRTRSTPRCSCSQTLIDPSKASSRKKSMGGLQTCFDGINGEKGHIDSGSSKSSGTEGSQKRRSGNALRTHCIIEKLRLDTMSQEQERVQCTFSEITERPSHFFFFCWNHQFEHSVVVRAPEKDTRVTHICNSNEESPISSLNCSLL